MSQPAAARPKSILRGHRAQVHVTAFVRQNQRLASGDADGFVVLWDLTIMRPRAVWRAHTNAILGISGWGDDKVITEGRDNRLVVWKITAHDEAALSTALPLDDSVLERPQPWILHILEINTMNFCSFAPCAARPDIDPAISEELLVAVPNTFATEAVDIYHLPSQNRQGTVHLGSKTEQKGMVMALSLFWLCGSLFLVAGYENGLAVVARRRRGGSWDILYKHQAHKQPVLSLDVAPDGAYFLTSGADAIITKHPIPNTDPARPSDPVAARTVSSGTGIDSDDVEGGQKQEPPGTNSSMLSASLASASTSSSGTQPTRGLPKKVTKVEAGEPLKTINTKHSGQQGLRIRSDGRIFATAGWDAKIRVYSAKTMAELAVLKWHDVGCYAVAFAVLGSGQKDAFTETKDDTQKSANEVQPEAMGNSVAANLKEMDMATAVNMRELSVKDKRIQMAKETHWLAAGSKDGKISLWDIY
ncbi:WD40 repeat-like protein [Xylariaceae sp. FL1651]|nr:WD40 repeat-like protein [Xylariaceae sp. FL1651]